MSNLISFSLFGDNPKYNLGAVQNVARAREHYPGWNIRFYVDPFVTVKDELRRLGCDVVEMRKEPGGKAMSWRFLAAMEPWERVVFRDADSRIGPREAAAVKDWIIEGALAHIMRDHEHHRCYPIFGGMWGIKGGRLTEMRKWINQWPKWGERMDDMLLIEKHVWPLIRNDCTHHTSVPNKWGGVPFPEHAPCAGFVGEIINA